MANDMFDYDAPKGSAVAFGTSLLKDVRGRADKKAKDMDKFAKKIMFADLATKGAGWILDNKVNDFHRGNATVYGNLSKLIDNSSGVLTKNQAILDSGLDYEKHFYNEAYDEISKEYAKDGKQTIGDVKIRQLAEEQGFLKQQKWQNLVKSASQISGLSMEDLKEQILKDSNVSKSLADIVMKPASRILKGKSRQSIEQEGKEITLQNLQGKEFDNLRTFKTSIEAWLGSSKTSAEETAAANLISAIKDADKQVIDVKTNVGPASEVYNQLTNKNEMLGKIFHIAKFADGSTKTTLEEYKIGERIPASLLTAAKMTAIEGIFNAKGMAEFNTEWNELTPNQKTAGDAFDRIYSEVGSNKANIKVDVDDTSLDALRYKTLAGLLDDTIKRGYDISKTDELKMIASEIWTNYQTVNLLEVLVDDKSMTKEKYIEAILSGIAVLPEIMPVD